MARCRKMTCIDNCPPRNPTIANNSCRYICEHLVYQPPDLDLSRNQSGTRPVDSGAAAGARKTGSAKTILVFCRAGVVGFGGNSSRGYNFLDQSRMPV